MAKKLSKAQERELEYIKRRSTPDEIQKSINYYTEHLKNPEDESWREWYQDHLDMYKDGWVLVQSNNSRTLEILEERGYIEYIKRDDRGRCVPIDWARLK